MKEAKKTLIIIAAFLAWSAACVFAGSFFAPEKSPGITAEPPQSNEVDRDLGIMTEAEKDRLIRIRDTAPFQTKIHDLGGGNWQLTGWMHDRGFTQKFTVHAPVNKNMILAGPTIDTDLYLGGTVQYYRMFNQVGVGGGINVSRRLIAEQDWKASGMAAVIYQF